MHQQNLNDSQQETQQQTWMSLQNIQETSNYQQQNGQQYNDSNNTNGPIFTEMKSIVIQQQKQHQSHINNLSQLQPLHLPMQTTDYRIVNNLEHNNDQQSINYVNTQQQIPTNSSQQYHYLPQEENNSNGSYQTIQVYFT